VFGSMRSRAGKKKQQPDWSSVQWKGELMTGILWVSCWKKRGRGSESSKAVERGRRGGKSETCGITREKRGAKQRGHEMSANDYGLEVKKN